MNKKDLLALLDKHLEDDSEIIIESNIYGRQKIQAFDNGIASYQQAKPVSGIITIVFKNSNEAILA